MNLNKDTLSNLSVLIFTKNRPDLLGGLLEYWSTTFAKVIVLDASTNDSTKLICHHYNVSYHWSPDFSGRVHEIRNLLTTDFACINSDDDVILHEGATKAIALLQTKIDLIGVASVRDFNEQHFNKRNALGKNRFLHSEECSFERLKSWTVGDLRTEYPWYSIWRAYPLLLALEASVPPKAGDIFTEEFATIGLRMCAAALGKFEVASFDIYMKRKHYLYFNDERIRKLSNISIPPVKPWIEKRDQDRIRKWSENASLKLSQQLNVEEKSLSLIFESIWAEYEVWEHERDSSKVNRVRGTKKLRQIIEKIYLETRNLDSGQRTKNIRQITFFKCVLQESIKILFVAFNIITLKRIPWRSKLLYFNSELLIFRDSGMLPLKDLTQKSRIWTYKELSPIDRELSAPKYLNAQLLLKKLKIKG